MPPIMPKNPEPALQELERRWRAIFTALVAGQDVAPSTRLRTEGMMETLVLLGLSSEGELQEALAEVYREVYSAPLREDWRELFPFPQVPGFGVRAPVVPSTRD